MGKASISWLPKTADLSHQIALLKGQVAPFSAWVALAQTNLNFLQTEMLNQALSVAFPVAPSQELMAPPIRLGLLGSSTTQHLHAAIRIAALRRGLWVDIYEPEYGQYFSELVDPSTGLHRFKPTAILFAFDARHMTRGLAAHQTDDNAAQIISDPCNTLHPVGS